MATRRKPKVFISYAKADRQAALALFESLMEAGAEPWIDEQNLVLGDGWEKDIPEAINKSDAVVICLSPRFNAMGYKQQEVRHALEASKALPPGRGFIIPFAIEPCEIPDWCKQYHAGLASKKAATFHELLRAIDKHCGSNLIKHENQISSKDYGLGEYGPRLEELVRRAEVDQDLCVSVGEADFAVTLITRLILEKETSGAEKPKIKSVVIKRLADNLVVSLAEAGKLDQIFGDTVRHNVERIRITLDKAGIPLRLILSTEIPSFHGWLYGDHAFVNEWEQDPLGCWHVRTRLRYYNSIRNQANLDEVRTAFGLV